ncbi:antibiotic biosynthesis monooxygenase family protein [Schlesneria sp. T3-172]|uniref:antibiotic biosynthesis monooxygenase family protein n=1 Tax=Schlesneria sphaerica TaxID=3373610 RepID=UPI0037C97008
MVELTGGAGEHLKPPYYAVIFTSKRSVEDPAGYSGMAERMEQLASQQPGFLGVESHRDRDGRGITVSYWADLASIGAWRSHSEHLLAQQMGKSVWYESYHVRICRVEQAYSFPG